MKAKTKRVKVAAIGGGTGLSTLLSALRELSCDITAIVAVTDNGGSSGRLRRDMGVLPPGDIRNCLIALADNDYNLEQILKYRFPKESELAGHNLGNLMLTAAVQMNGGDFAAGVKQLSLALGIRDDVLPVTTDDITLTARMSDGAVVNGETEIVDYPASIECVYVEPQHTQPLPEVLDALKEADYILLGPGSLYTSIITNLLIDKVADTIAESHAEVYYICNIATQPGEAEMTTASSYVEKIIAHTRRGLLDGIIVNTAVMSDEQREFAAETGSYQIMVDKSKLLDIGLQVIGGDLLNDSTKYLWRHNILKLVDVLRDILI